MRATNAGEYQPVAAEGYLGWQQNTAAKPKKYIAYLKQDGEAKIRLNATGTRGAMGGIDGTTVVFQEYQPNLGVSDLKLYDVGTGLTTEPPEGVNTHNWEYWPSISGSWLLFGRLWNDGSRDLFLFDVATGEERVIASAGENGFIGPGQVNGDYAAWYKCAGGECNVFRYTISSDTKEEIPNPGKFQYAASVTASGVVYFSRHGPLCAHRARLVRHPLGGPSTVLVKLAAERDITDTYVYTDAEAQNQVFYDRFKLTAKCKTPAAKSDIYKIVDPDVATSETSIGEPEASGERMTEAPTGRAYVHVGAVGSGASSASRPLEASG